MISPSGALGKCNWCVSLAIAHILSLHQRRTAYPPVPSADGRAHSSLLLRMDLRIPHLRFIQYARWRNFFNDVRSFIKIIQGQESGAQAARSSDGMKIQNKELLFFTVFKLSINLNCNY